MNVTQLTFLDPVPGLMYWGQASNLLEYMVRPFCTPHWPDGLPSFLEVYQDHGSVYIWGDVLKGIEDISHNMTAALLALPLGNMASKCFFDQQFVAYRYSPFALWVPYGVSTTLYSHVIILPFPPLCFIDSLGNCSNFTCCWHYNNGKK
jgi:hypothetical protein